MDVLVALGLVAAVAALALAAGWWAASMARRREVAPAAGPGLADQAVAQALAALRADWEAAAGDAAALRVLVDQVASLTDVRALTLHRRWCRDTA